MVDVHEASDTRETAQLISSEKVAGTAVENPRGDSLGSIEEVMIDKVSGRVGYAVLKYGSFLGMGGKLFAVPWDVLKYDRQRQAYIIDIPEDRLRNAPSFEAGREPDMADRAWNRQVHDYYGSGADWYL